MEHTYAFIVLGSNFGKKQKLAIYLFIYFSASSVYARYLFPDLMNNVMAELKPGSNQTDK